MPTGLPAGRLRERIDIQSVTRTLDDSGTPVDVWADVAANVPAEVLAVAGGEQFRGRQVHAEANMVFIIRWRSDVTVYNRVVWNDGNYGIVYVGDPYGERTQLRIEARGAP